MKKLLSMLIALSMLMSSVTMMSVNAEETAENAKNIVWIGGSYAAGAAHQQGTEALPTGVTAQPFAKIITDYLDTQYKETVNYYNVAIGGTTSEYGLARFERDVISKDPDVVFIEFSGNDRMYSSYFDRPSIAVEGMIRRIQTYEKEMNKEVDIVFYYRPLIQRNSTYDADVEYAVENVYKPLAKYYGIYELDPTKAAKDLWEADGVTYESLISDDGAHPKALGHYYIGKASKNLLEKNPISHQNYRKYPMNLGYKEIQPVWKAPSEEGFYDTANSSGCTVNDDETVTITNTEGESTFTFKFKGRSICVADCTTDRGAGTYTISVDGAQITNGLLSTTDRIDCLGAKHTYADGDHTLTITVTGGGTLKIGKIEVDAIANDSAVARENDYFTIYNDPCETKEDIAGRTINGYAAIRTIGNNTVMQIAASESYNPLTYNATALNGFSTDYTVHNIEIDYYEYQPAGNKSELGLRVIALDAGGNVIKTLAEDEMVREWNGSDSGSKRYKLKAYDLPANTKVIRLGKPANSERPTLSGNGNNQPYNTSIADVKIGYAAAAVEGISLIVPEYASKGSSDTLSVKQRFTNGSEAALPEGVNVTYSSSDETIATVEADGKINFLTGGGVVIHASAVIGGVTYTAEESIDVKNIRNYADSATPEKPANLITNLSAIASTNNAGDAGFDEKSDSTGIRYLKNASGGWQGCGPNFLPSKAENKGAMVNLERYVAGKTYVFTSRVKNSTDATVTTNTPIYGISYNMSTYGNSKGTNEYGMTGFPVTSREYVDYKATLTIDSAWAPSDAWNRIYHGLRTTTPLNTAVTVEKSLDSLYLAEEIPYEIKLTPDNETGLARGGKLNVTAEVLNQIGLKGGLDQTVEWAVVSQDRKAVIENVTMTVKDNTVTLSCDDTLPLGTYTVVAVSDKYGMVKGLDFDVIDDLSVKYADFATPEKPANLITDSNMLNNDAGNAGKKNVKDVGYQYTANDDTTKGAWNIFPTSAFIAVNSKGGNMAVNLDYYKKGTTYVVTAKVKNSSTDTTLIPYYGIAIPAKNDYSYGNGIGSNEYGKDGMPVTSTEWTDFKATITFPTTWKEENTSTNVGQKIFAGIGKKSPVGSSVTIQCAGSNLPYLAEEILYNITNEVVSGDTSLASGESVTLKSELTNQIGLKGGLKQEVEWIALSADRKQVIDTITIAKDENGNAVVSVNNTPAGDYVIVAYSDNYKAAKGINVNVIEKKTAQATVTLSQDVGYSWMNASVENAECDSITFAIAAYNKDENGVLKLTKVNTAKVVVTNGVASTSNLWLDEDEAEEAGTIVKGFVWTDTMQPIGESGKVIVIGQTENENILTVYVSSNASESGTGAVDSPMTLENAKKKFN